MPFAHSLRVSPALATHAPCGLFGKILGKNVTVKLELAGGGPRYFDGYVTPMGPNVVPVPYPIAYTMDTSRQCLPNVFVNGKPMVRTGDQVWMNQKPPA